MKKKREAAEADATPMKSAEFGVVIAGLSNAMISNWIVAGVVFAMAAAIGIVGFFQLPVLTDHSVAELKENEGNIVLGVFVILRATAFAGALVALFWGMLNLARAALDQATRYQKRLMAAHFMHYVFDEYSERIGQDGFTLQEVINAIDAWSSNVESAYTKVRFGKGGAENWNVTTPDGSRIAFGREAVRHVQPASTPDKATAAP
ncbi:hypothetical protein [Microbacterium sp. VKM Ac-2923]|uniref:hypothetical protein n=1 Tax=Microbacterium sp. VKM Ac-2923 TaxID=2929476 RepID=UPI001FB337DF|nr:hypothetical protein [Microbacterium sp. VKM Ac-2923]MCJ1708549.1 hypothetical protein [Microbacterium sp. VKM Ac-2923]